MLPLLRLMRKVIGWVDFIAFTMLMYLLSWLPWPGIHPVARLFQAWSRAFVRALDVDLRLHQKNRRRLPTRFILIANHPAAFEDIGIPALFDVVSLAKLQVQGWFVVGRISKCSDGWCRIEIGNRRGYVRTSDVWGVGENEVVD